MPKKQISPPLLSYLPSIEDQQWINANLPKDNEVMVNGIMSNGGCKQRVNTELTFSKRNVINKISKMNYRTPRKKIAELLTLLFMDCSGVKDGHWFYIAQHWNPRAIGRVLKDMVKKHKRGDIDIKNPAAYFTYLIKFRKRRKFPKHNKHNGQPAFARYIENTSQQTSQHPPTQENKETKQATLF